jgi:hypothetical protein
MLPSAGMFSLIGEIKSKLSNVTLSINSSGAKKNLNTVYETTIILAAILESET